MPYKGEEASAELVKVAAAHLRLALDSVGDGSWDWNIASGEVFFSDRWIDSLRYRRSAIYPNIHFWKSRIHPDDEERFRKLTREHFEGRTNYFEIEYRLQMATDEYRWTLDRGRVLERDEDGEATRIAGTSFDISRRKAEEQAHRQTEMKYRAIVDTAGCAIVAFDSNLRIVEWNRAAEEIFGWRRAEVWGKNYVEKCLPEPIRATVTTEIRRVFAGGESKSYENNVVTRDGSERTLLWNATRLLSTDGETLGIVGIGQDITERKGAGS